MNNIISVLKNCILFKNFEEEEIKHILNNINYKICSYEKQETIALESDKCNSIGILLDGTVEIQKLFSSGKTVTVDILHSGDIFGEVIVFSNTNTYPSSIIASKNTTVLFITKEYILKLCSLNSILLNNLMSLLSNKILMLNKKVKYLSYNTLRQKIASFLLEQYSTQKNLTIKLNLSREALSELLAIPRPSLSRELINMKKDGLIDFNKNIIVLNSREDLEEILY
ncbi:Crp/Fnr family transcriptional regulator [Clostridium niameyense]|uniref:Crp/Fnr family transcriptional regulator n=1 Tax=Clostridium niameyense TaxID=1622073 RepID=A0A6M0R6E2_9CLOT|nr:Crp/Fnr family transcriptional regulator [Clostridium niameyense]NEZ45735.1 Crp/Fnr family transcriptional regulator [Clostridium niameyense]